LHGWTALVFRDRECVGTGRWNGTGISDRPRLLGETPEAEDAIYARLEGMLGAVVHAAFAELPAPMNAEGVDMALIDEMLRMTPRERLLALQDSVQSVVDLMAHAGHEAP